MDKCLIVSGAPDCHIPELRGTEFVIACDYGYRHAMDNGIRPDLVLGDFDSLTEPVPSYLNIKQVPAEKDDTDTMLAVREALDRGFREIVIAGGLGGRIDHELGNIMASVFAAEHGARCYLVDEHHQIFAIKDTTCRIARGAWRSLSVFSVSDRSEGITMRGVKYSLTDAVMENTFPLGVSNSFTADHAEITVRKGTLLIVLTDL